MQYIGICVGASTISIVCLKEGTITHFSKGHDGNPKETLKQLLNNFDLTRETRILVTGRRFKEFINLENISEPEAIEYAIEGLNLKGYDTLISAGGENLIIYALDKNSKIIKVQTGNKCASGTGEFFLQQIARMNLDVNEATNLGLLGKPHKISGRCSVFCKSDCTHALNKGETKSSIVAGLCQMMANKILELVSKVKYSKVLFVGGVSKNTVVINNLREKIPDLIIPEESTYFEAYGAAIAASKKDMIPVKRDIMKNLFINIKSSFTFHKPLQEYISLVEFRKSNNGIANPNDICILGLDVGSTTTKAVLLRTTDHAVLASVYLRTNGDPISASINCYRGLKEQLSSPLRIIGLGVTGSGRYIAGLHAQTKNIINEIIAHATAAAFYDPDVDTIFEIGGQDAKYTYLTNSVPTDYAMNEACSAGTGSFLEESAKESLNVSYLEISDIALHASNPPNFNDQCAAFISSDIKNAIHEGISKEDIIAGLVYSINMNYVNRVKGNRPIGQKIFMQGGVCYNKAIPIAMAALTGNNIIVPPEPGLMGAYGAALEVQKRLNLDLTKEQEFSLDNLMNTKFSLGKSFRCYGDNNDCDRKCEINLLDINGKKYAFGGACNKYYNQNLEHDDLHQGEDLVVLRQKMVYEEYANAKFDELKNPHFKTIGIVTSFMTNTYYPLFYNFFTKLGLKVVISDVPDPEGAARIGSSFCYPVEISHGLFHNLLKKNPDYIFLPHITEIGTDDSNVYKRTCVFVQSEPYYLKTAFKEILAQNNVKLLTPIISLHDGIESARKYFISLAAECGIDQYVSNEAYNYAALQQESMFKKFKELGRNALRRIEQENVSAIVLFGRPYNTFTKDANLGIPKKFSSRSKIVIPYDFLMFEDEEHFNHMYWGLGGNILKAASLIKKNPLLFGCYVTNFSCGPDSFLISYFRNIMGIKPSLILELDSHSADAGVNTRVEAFLDIIDRYIQLKHKGLVKDIVNDTELAKVIIKKKGVFVSLPESELIPITDKKVKIVFPSMGEFATRAITASFKARGMNASRLPIPDMNTLKAGRAHTTCKECLPLILTTGNIIEYLKYRNPAEITLFFMPNGEGPCRQGQYHILQQNLFKKLRLSNIGVLSLGDEDGYQQLGVKIMLLTWAGILAAEYLEDIKSVLRVIAVDNIGAMKIFDKLFDDFITIIEKGSITKILRYLKIISRTLKKIPLRISIEQAKFVSLVGEIYVRRDEFSRSQIVSVLEKNEFIVLPTHTGEYIYYCNYLRKKSMVRRTVGMKNYMVIHASDFFARNIEKYIKKELASSGLGHNGLIDVEETLNNSKHLISEELLGEAILTIGSSLREVIDKTCGVISIGPFACMPGRVAESILSKEMTLKGKNFASKKNYFIDVDELPFLSIETDGNPLPQILQSRLEIFMLQANRLHDKLLLEKNKNNEIKN